MIHARDDYNRIQDPAGLIPEDEPVFLMRAQDELCEELTREWARRNAEIGGDPALTARALAHADRMAKWPVKKKADLHRKL